MRAYFCGTADGRNEACAQGNQPFLYGDEAGDIWRRSCPQFNLNRSGSMTGRDLLRSTRGSAVHTGFKHPGDDMGFDLKALVNDRFGLDLSLSASDALTPLLAQILGRRTHRNYTAQPVPEELIDLLLAVALSASSKSDFQQA